MNNVKELKIEKQKLQDCIDRIQKACSHPEDCVTKKHHGDTGNWDPSDDSYWTTFDCDLCEKHWMLDGSL